MPFAFFGARQGGHLRCCCCGGECHSKALGGSSRHGDGRKCTVRGSLGHDGSGYHLGKIGSFHNTDDIINPARNNKGNSW